MAIVYLSILKTIFVIQKRGDCPRHDDDMARLATMVDRLRHESRISRDFGQSSHIDIAHPVLGEWVRPCTRALLKSSPKTCVVVAGTLAFQVPGKALTYLEALEANGRYPHTIWPTHCLIGSYGHNVMPVLYDALIRWETERFGVVDYVTKGSNLWTERFSAVRAEVRIRATLVRRSTLVSSKRWKRLTLFCSQVRPVHIV